MKEGKTEGERRMKGWRKKEKGKEVYEGVEEKLRCGGDAMLRRE